MTPRFVVSLVFLALPCACASVETPAEPAPEPTVAELVDRARAVPLTEEASPASRAAWTMVLDRAESHEHRVQALYCIAMAWKREGLLDPMLANLEELVLVPVRHPLRTRGFRVLAHERHRRGDVVGALAAIECFLLSDPVDRAWTAGAWISRAQWLVELDHPDRAREALRIFVETYAPSTDRHEREAVQTARTRLAALDRAE